MNNDEYILDDEAICETLINDLAISSIRDMYGIIKVTSFYNVNIYYEGSYGIREILNIDISDESLLIKMNFRKNNDYKIEEFLNGKRIDKDKYSFENKKNLIENLKNSAINIIEKIDDNYEEGEGGAGEINLLFNKKNTSVHLHTKIYRNTEFSEPQKEEKLKIYDKEIFAEINELLRKIKKNNKDLLKKFDFFVMDHSNIYKDSFCNKDITESLEVSFNDKDEEKINDFYENYLENFLEDQSRNNANNSNFSEDLIIVINLKDVNKSYYIAYIHKLAKNFYSEAEKEIKIN